MAYGRASDRRVLDWVFAIAIVGVFMFLGYSGLQSMNKPRVSAVVEKHDPAPPERLPPGTYYFEIPADGPVPVEKPAAPGSVSIYECVVDGQKVLSDRDCGPGSVQRDVDTSSLNTYEAGPIPSVDMRRYSAPPQEYTSEPIRSAGSASDSRAWEQERKKQKCAAIQGRIDWINARMRAGYTSQEGEYWRARWYEAKNAYSEARCGKSD